MRALNVANAVTTVGGLQALQIVSSKADQQGLGEILPLDHICQLVETPTWCPPCCLKRQVRARLREGAQSSDPLFANKRGERLSMMELAALVEETASKMGLALVSNRGIKKFGTHKFRISGACYLALKGATEQEICGAGRWASVEAMRKYLRGVPRVLGASLAASLLGKDRARATGGNPSSSPAPGLPRLTITQAAVDGVAVKNPLASEMTSRANTLMVKAETLPCSGAKDLIVKSVGNEKGHLRRIEGEHLTGVTACGEFVDEELSLEASRSVDIKDMCPVCITLRDFDAWISENIEVSA